METFDPITASRAVLIEVANVLGVARRYSFVIVATCSAAVPLSGNANVTRSGAGPVRGIASTATSELDFTPDAMPSWVIGIQRSVSWVGARIWNVRAGKSLRSACGLSE